MEKFRIFLRKVKRGDAGLISRWFNDKKNMKYMSTVVRCEVHSKKDWERRIKESDSTFERLFMVCRKAGKKRIGHAGIDDLDFHDKRGEVFFLIGEKEEQGKGYGKEILALLLDYAFKKLKLNSLFATATLENKPSQRVLQRAGFRKIGIRRGYNYIDGKFLDEVFFDMTAEDYRKSKKKN